MPGQRVTDKIRFKIMWGIIAILGSLCIFFIRGWYNDINISKMACAEEIKKLENESKKERMEIKERVIILETIIPEVRNFMEKLDNRMSKIEFKK